MVLALSTTNKIGLLSVALVFIAFSLAASFLFPRANPNFPGRGLRVFIVVTIVLTIAMLGAVEVFAVEDEEPHEESPVAAETITTAETTTGAETTTEAETTPEEPSGSAEAGEAVFTSAGCGACHVLEAAGGAGEVGPNLDETLAGKDEDYIRESIVEPNAVIAEGYQEGVMPANYREQLDDEQLGDLVALLAQSS